MARVVGLGLLGPEFKSHISVELIPGGVDSETAKAAPTLCTEYGPDGWMDGWMDGWKVVMHMEEANWTLLDYMSYNPFNMDAILENAFSLP